MKHTSEEVGLFPRRWISAKRFHVRNMIVAGLPVALIAGLLSWSAPTTATAEPVLTPVASDAGFTSHERVPSVDVQAEACQSG